MKTTKRLFVALLFICLAILPALARAEGGDPGWQDVNGAMVQPGESFQATHLVAAAYAFIWLMVAGFVVTVWRRSAAVERDLESLRRRIEQPGAGEKRAG